MNNFTIIPIKFNNSINMVSMSECVQWSDAQHLIYNFAPIKLLGFALFLLVAFHFAKSYRYFILRKAPDFKPILNFIEKHFVELAGYIIIAFILWSMSLMGLIEIPYINDFLLFR